MIWFVSSIDCEKYMAKHIFQTHYRIKSIDYEIENKQTKIDSHPYLVWVNIKDSDFLFF